MHEKAKHYQAIMANFIVWIVNKLKNIILQLFCLLGV